MGTQTVVWSENKHQREVTILQITLEMNHSVLVVISMIVTVINNFYSSSFFVFDFPLKYQEKKLHIKNKHKIFRSMVRNLKIKKNSGITLRDAVK